MAHQPLPTYSHCIPVHFRNCSDLLCPICDLPVPLETAKTDENGRAFHEDCYALKLALIQASGDKGSAF